jgi:phage N-6-adenine-methyltransferase
MHNILIDEEFKALIPPLSQEERTQLEANLLADGCRDPLVVWVQPAPEPGTHKCYAHDESKCDLVPEDDVWHCRHCEHNPARQEYVLVDGHNRYEICARHDLPFDTVEVEFDSRSHAVEWIIKNQFGRRNLSDYQRGVLALRMKPIMEERARAQQQGGQGGVLLSQKSDEAKPIRTDEAVSELANVSRDTIRKIERIEEVAQPEVKALAAAGDVSINLASQFVELPQEVQQEAIAAIAEHHEPAKEVMREAVHNHRAQGTGENEWYTPQEHIDAAYKVLGSIDLDPASSEIANQRVKAGRIFTIADDGLTKEWGGKVWMNPPYAQPHIANFIEKLASEYEAGRVTEAIALTHNYTDTQWFHRAALSCAAICFTRGRIGFLSPEGKRAAPTQGQAFFYYGSKIEQFIESFCRIGFVVEVRNA